MFRESAISLRARVCKQVTRGHNIVADGWAGASTPQPPSHTQTYTKSIENSRFSTFRLDRHGPTDGRTNGRTDGWTKPLIELRDRN